MSTRMQRIFAWSGPVATVAFLVGFAVAHFIPIPSPQDSSHEIATFFRNHSTGIRVGMWLTGGASALFITWSVAISTQLRRISPKHAGYSSAELLFGVLLVVETIIPCGLWESAAFRPGGLGEQLTMRLNDSAALMFVGVAGTAIVQTLVIGIAILEDKRANPLFPRWLGWAVIAIAPTWIPSSLCVFTKSGLFAWDGTLAWWFAVGTFTLWIVLLSWGVLRAIAQQEREELSAEAVAQHSELQYHHREFAV